MVQKISDITELSITHENDTDAESPEKIKKRKMPEFKDSGKKLSSKSSS